MRILITGGAGFIGSHLAERLLRQGHSVVIVDDFSSGKMSTARNVCAGYPVEQAYWLWRNCSDPDFKLTLVAESCDFVYHLAATVGVKRVLENPAACIENNIESLRNVLRLGIPGLFTSTSEVYGRTNTVLREDSPILYSSKSRWSYAASKLIGEWMCQQAPGWKAVRLFNVVGPRQSTSYGAVLPKFVSQAIADEPITVYGDGSQVRTFIDVRDCVEILDRLRDKTFDVVNIGGSVIRSMDTLAEDVKHVLGSKSPIIHVPYEVAYPEGFEECPFRLPQLEKLDSLLSELPYTSFNQTITDLAEVLQHDTVCE